MKTNRKPSAAQNRQADDEAPIQKSSRTIWVAIFILLILTGLGYLLFSSLGLEGELNRQRILVSAIALMLLIMGLLVFIRGWFKKTEGKKKKIQRKALGKQASNRKKQKKARAGKR